MVVKLEEVNVYCLCFQVKSNDDLLAAMAGGNPASSNAVTKTKRTASIGTNANTLDSKPKTSGIPKGATPGFSSALFVL